MSDTTMVVAQHGGLVVRTIDDMYRLAKVMLASGMLPSSYRKPEEVFVAIQFGYEVGLTPMAALNSIAVIQGRPTLWGDGALAVVRASGLMTAMTERAIEDGYECTVRRGDEEPETRRFTFADAKRAGLVGKSGPWQQYPMRMCQMRARAYALRDVFPDALRGVAIREEVMDFAATPAASVMAKISGARVIDGVAKTTEVGDDMHGEAGEPTTVL
jgi:hypothetical protein